MELEEMKGLWTEMSGQIERQNRLTDKLIIRMTQVQYKNRLGKIRSYEIIGTVISFALALIILINLDKYDTMYLMISGIVSIVILLVLPVLSLSAIHKMNDLNIRDNNYKQVLTDYAKSKSRFLAVQKLSFFLSFVLMIVTLPVMVKIMDGKTVSLDSNVWFWYLPVGFLFFSVFAKWVYGYYVRTTVQLANLLKELEE